MNIKLTIFEILEICFVGIIVVILDFFLSNTAIIGLGFGVVIVMRYIFEKSKEGSQL